MKKINRNIIAYTFVLALILMPLNKGLAASASEVGYIAGSGFTSLIYTPIKFASALFLGIIGGLSLLGTVPAGVQDHSAAIVKTGYSGDWWISPSHLRGERPFIPIELPK